jgi:ribosomal protein S17
MTDIVDKLWGWVIVNSSKVEACNGNCNQGRHCDCVGIKEQQPCSVTCNKVDALKINS